MDFEIAFEQTKTKKHFEGYHEYYKNVLGKENISSVLEIGVGTGASLYSWKKIWPNANISGIDIVEPPINVKKDFQIYLHDSTSSNNANLLLNQYDLIVDDGDQNWSSKLRTFLNYYTKANQYYVIENLMGEYSVNKLFSKLPQLHLTTFYIFKSTGTRRTYSFRENENRIIEKDTTPFIMFIKVQNFTKRFINNSIYREEMLDIKENKILDGIEESYDMVKNIREQSFKLGLHQ